MLLATADTSCAQNEQALPAVNQQIALLLSQEDLQIQGAAILTQALLAEVYENHNFYPFWTNQNRVVELLTLIENSADHGLNPADYNVELLRALSERQVLAQGTNISETYGAEEDILLTESLLRYGYHRRMGKVIANTLDPDINYRRESFRNQPASITVEQALSWSSLTDFIEMAAPVGPVYGLLQQKLAQYRDIAAAGGWPMVDPGPTLRVGDHGPRVRQIRERLSVTDNPGSGPITDTEAFDPLLAQALISFQSRHALDEDGIAGKRSIEAMNVPVETRIDQLRLSLERLRWVNQEASETFVAVNIAGFRVFYFAAGHLVWSSRAMVGKEYRKTPVFRGDMAYLEFNPTWTIPPTILRDDTLPAIKKDPNYLASKNIRVIDQNGKFVDPASVDWNLYRNGVPYTLRQDAGPNNALGTVKFIFPNRHFVFLHDTPNPDLFNRPERAFSSGCIRVENPLELAELVLDDAQNYPRSELENIVKSRETQRVNLRVKIPVLIVYLTASVNEDGDALFYKDIYRRDQAVLEALNGPVILDYPMVD